LDKRSAMKLRQKTLYLVGGSLLVLLLLISLIVTRQSLQGFETLEQQSLTRDMERITNTLSDESEELAVNARAWAYWDETIAFVQGTQPDFDDTYSMDSTVPQGMGVQFTLFANKQGNIAYSKEFLDAGALEPSPELLGVFEDYLTRDPADLEEVVGIIQLPTNLALFAAVPILNNEAQGPAAGSVLVAKYISEDYLAELAEQTRLSPRLYLNYDGQLPSDVAAVKSELEQNDVTALVKPVNAVAVAAYAFLHDVNGEHVGIVRLEEPRTIYQQGMQQLRFMLVSLFAVGVVFVGFILFLLEKTVLSHLSRLSSHLRYITQSGQSSTRVEVTGKDELAMLATDLNGMLQVIEERTQALEQSKQELERSNQELERFAYVASHDLQEPLRKVQTFSDRITTKYKDKLDEEGKVYLARMQESLGRMRGLIQDVLNYSRVQSSKKEWTMVDLNEVVRGVISDLEVRLEQSGGRVIVTPLPVVQANPLQMRQVFQNLLGNALKFKKIDAPPLVKVSAKVTNGNHEISVEDNGIGFEQQYAEKVFEVFQRLHSRGSYEGTGIGLAIVRKVLESHGGDVRAESTPGKGTLFLLTLPITQPQPDFSSREVEAVTYNSVVNRH
jgi:signal transduction histidine kinase